ncbi:MAG TPA: DUF1993 domain-containing protein [Brevundimonas sp.]|jgi:hypothetical protein|uniref:DUF1993 domain-containing protein n=1 Tax=Brevundimonas sp. TaxID=1871086 RepID=UPI002B993E48|nr:DUF1993 domain-containing protein [Brevundimonas sp.]HRH19083.1 DUF1993 domain-containing protein [Brevundimonas sp.]
MELSLYSASAPMFIRGLDVLSGLLDKAEASALSEAELFEARLAEDMRPFPDQIRMAAFGARSCMARLAGIEWPRTDDSEATLADLKATIALTRSFISQMPPDALDGAETRPITLKLPSMELNFVGEGYLTSFALPNFYFHLSMAYAILRSRGVDLGKRDFLGNIALV